MPVINGTPGDDILTGNPNERDFIYGFEGDDTLRGLFLKKLRAKYDAARDDEQRRRIEQAARWGLAALDNMEEVAKHEDQ